ncbi:MAG: YcaO-like family protein, partial [Candidatus Omnitrophica bacterium]|nr:YcaO-like family protein [Candidatus Omnitrophota bacterium]
MFGKDAKPKDTIRVIRSILKRAGFSVGESSWKHPVPHVWSVHVRERACPRLCANGKGASRELALASAFAEFMERLNTGYFFSDYTIGGPAGHSGFYFFPQEKWFPVKGRRLPEGILDTHLRCFYDPENKLAAEHLVERISGRTDICAVPFTRVRDGGEIYFPVSILDNLYATNGMASGNTPGEARVQALSEILERYVKNKIIAGGLALPEIPRKYYACFSPVTAAIEALERKGFRVLVLDASLAGRYPVVNITLIERNSTRCFLAFGAHPSFGIALTRTLTELLQGKDADDFSGLQRPVAGRALAADSANLEAHFIDSSGVVSWGFFEKKPDFPFRHVDFQGSRLEELAYLSSVIHKEHRDIYIADFAESGFYTCRIVVPGMSEVYPVDDLVFANYNRGMKFRKEILCLPSLGRKALARLLGKLNSGDAGDEEAVSHLIGIAFEETSPWTQVCFGELKMLIQLAAGRTWDARRQMEWCFDTGCFRKEIRPLYDCV